MQTHRAWRGGRVGDAADHARGQRASHREKLTWPRLQASCRRSAAPLARVGAVAILSVSIRMRARRSFARACTRQCARTPCARLRLGT
eukprot:6181873-Pleurochrysis_carterae.AAC.2